QSADLGASLAEVDPARGRFMISPGGGFAIHEDDAGLGHMAENRREIAAEWLFGHPPILLLRCEKRSPACDATGRRRSSPVDLCHEQWLDGGRAHKNPVPNQNRLPFLLLVSNRRASLKD